MTNRKQFKAAMLIATALAAGGCSLLKKNAGPKTPVIGQRIDVLTSETDVQRDRDTALMPMTLPAPVVNSEWAQSGGNAAHTMGHLSLGQGLTQVYSIQAGRGSSLAARLASPPIVANGKVFTIDTLGTVRAFEVTTGRSLWASQTPVEKGGEHSLYGGGLAFEDGRIYATNGIGFVAALAEANGGIIWKVRPGGPLRGAPSVANGNLYVISQDNQIYSLDEKTGATNWSAAASLEIAGVFGSASPAIAQGTVVAGFSSGELNAYRYENGRQVWQDALQRTSISTSVSSLSDVDADPVIDNGQVFAIGQGGRMVALELTSGQRQWELNVAGLATPWVAGDWLFIVSDDAKLVCINRGTGRVRWINQLPGFVRTKSKKGQINYSGPVLAGNRLIVVGSNGALVTLDPATGSFKTQTALKVPVSLPPVVADNMLFILDDSGRLHAFR